MSPESREINANQVIEDLHRKACERGEYSYTDPETGYLVFTELEHKKRGHCCDSGCRHCPYREKN